MVLEESEYGINGERKLGYFEYKDKRLPLMTVAFFANIYLFQFTSFRNTKYNKRLRNLFDGKDGYSIG